LSGVLILVILIFNSFNDQSVISAIFTVAGYTYGPLLGMYAFGLFTRYRVYDKVVPVLCILSPILCYAVSHNSARWFNGYEFGFELLIVNGAITFVGMLILRKREIVAEAA